MGVSRARWRAGAVATLLVAAALGASAQDAGAAPSSRDCADPNAPQPCIRYCSSDPVPPGRVPCWGGNVPKPTSGTFSYVVPLSAADQDATGIPGDPGGTGSSSIS